MPYLSSLLPINCVKWQWVLVGNNCSLFDFRQAYNTVYCYWWIYSKPPTQVQICQFADADYDFVWCWSAKSMVSVKKCGPHGFDHRLFQSNLLAPNKPRAYRLAMNASSSSSDRVHEVSPRRSRASVSVQRWMWRIMLSSTSRWNAVNMLSLHIRRVANGVEPGTSLNMLWLCNLPCKLSLGKAQFHAVPSRAVSVAPTVTWGPYARPLSDERPPQSRSPQGAITWW